MSHGTGQEDSEAAYLCDGIYNSYGVTSPERRGDVSVFLPVDECGKQLMIIVSWITRDKTLPLLEDGFWIHGERLQSAGYDGEHEKYLSARPRPNQRKLRARECFPGAGTLF